MDIQIDTVKTKKTGEEILEITNNLDDEIKKLKNIITKIQNSWIGNNANSFVDAMNGGTIPKLEELGNLLKDYGKYLDDVSQAYCVLDDSYSSKNIEGDSVYEN